jgi:hypothetical protein
LRGKHATYRSIQDLLRGERAIYSSSEEFRGSLVFPQGAARAEHFWRRTKAALYH